MTPEERQDEHVRLANLIQELDVALEWLEAGLAILQRSRPYRTKRFAFLLLLTNGLERLMKVILILHTLHTEGRYLSIVELRSLGHNLLTLRDQVLACCFTNAYRRDPLAQHDYDFVAHDPVLAELFAIMSDFARIDRYAYLDGIAAPTIWETGPPDRRWGDLELAQLSPGDLAATLRSSEEEQIAKRRVVQVLVVHVEQCIRALARLFTSGLLGEQGRTVGTAPALWNFALLDDSRLGVRQYSTGDEPS